jgi:hypothetical protein
MMAFTATPAAGGATAATSTNTNLQQRWLAASVAGAASSAHDDAAHAWRFTGVPLAAALCSCAALSFQRKRHYARAGRHVSRVSRAAKARRILYKDDGRKALMRGIDKLAETVAVTLGPRGRNVLLDKGEYSAPQIVNDGVTIAKEVELEDQVENTGVQLIRQAAAKTNDVAGDGTTTATILAHGMVKSGLKQLVGGANPVQLRNGMVKATEFVVGEIQQKLDPSRRAGP